MATYSGDSQRFDTQYNSRETRVNTMSKFDRFFYNLNEGTNKDGVCFFFLIMMVVTVVAPTLILLLVLVIPFVNRKYFNVQNRTFEMPLRLPIHANVADGSNIPATNEPYSKKTHEKYLAKGTLLMGNERETNQQVWLSDDDMLTHITIIGTTKSGKTFVIFMFMLQALIKNSGFMYADAKGDITTLKNICQLLRRFGRQDDFLLISFLPYEVPEFGDKSKATNTMNIFKVSSATTATELIISMMDGADDMWKGRSITYITSKLQSLATARDLGIIELSANKILELMELRALEEYVWKTVRENGNPRLLRDSKAIEQYLLNIPAYDKKKFDNGEGQDSTTKDQHGYVTMQILRALNDLSYNYGHIFGKEGSDVDMVDVVFNRRNLVIALPALGRSVSTLAMLARIIVSSVKQVGAIALGSKIEGSVRLNIDARPSNANNIYTVMFDEVGYMMTQGMSIMPAQFRAYNISVIFSGQSYANLKKDNDLEAQEIWTNTNIKIIGRYTGGEDLEDWTKVQGLGGKYYVPRITQMRRERGESTFNPSQEVNYSEEWRIKLDDIATQESGEFAFIMSKKSTQKTQGAGGRVAIAYTKVMYPLPNEPISHVFVNEKIHLSVDSLYKISQGREGELLKEIPQMAVSVGNKNEDMDSFLFYELVRLTQEYQTKERLFKTENFITMKPLMADIWLKTQLCKRSIQPTEYTPTQVLKDGVDDLANRRLLDDVDFDVFDEVMTSLWQGGLKQDGLEFSFVEGDEAEVLNKRQEMDMMTTINLERLNVHEFSQSSVVKHLENNQHSDVIREFGTLLVNKNIDNILKELGQS